MWCIATRQLPSAINKIYNSKFLLENKKLYKTIIDKPIGTERGS